MKSSQNREEFCKWNWFINFNLYTFLMRLNRMFLCSICKYFLPINWTHPSCSCSTSTSIRKVWSERQKWRTWPTKKLPVSNFAGYLKRKNIWWRSINFLHPAGSYMETTLSIIYFRSTFFVFFCNIVGKFSYANYCTFLKKKSVNTIIFIFLFLRNFVASPSFDLLSMNWSNKI